MVEQGSHVPVVVGGGHGHLIRCDGSDPLAGGVEGAAVQFGDIVHGRRLILVVVVKPRWSR